MSPKPENAQPASPLAPCSPKMPAVPLVLQPGEEHLRGVLERILFFNDENHYCIGELAAESATDDAPRTVVITGTLPGVQCGETLEVAGTWTHNPKYGTQFKLRTFRGTLPGTVYGIRKYLGSGLIPGIGKKYAEAIVDAFGADTLSVINEDSGRLREVPGIGQKRAGEIKRAWDEQHALREIMIFLQTYGAGVAQCLRLVKKYGPEAKDVLLGDPYRVAREIDGIGFKTADRIALNLGFANDSPPRLDAGILHCLKDLESEGHTGYPIDALQLKASEMLDAGAQLVLGRIKALVESGAVEHDTRSGLIQLPPLAYAERVIAEHCARLLEAPGNLPPIKIEAAIAWAQEQAGFTFAPEQSTAVAAALSQKMLVLTGGPGTGKTTILRAIVAILKVKKCEILLAASTGRAAQRMSETAHFPASTLHRLLKFDAAQGRFLVNENNALKCRMLIVDEVSMLDARLAAATLRALPSNAHLLWVGDAFQLPSVGAGNVLADILASQRVPSVALSQIFRQKAHSGIVRCAHGLLEGRTGPPPAVPSADAADRRHDLVFIHAEIPEVCMEKTIALCRDWLPKAGFDPLKDVQVLAPMHRGTVGIESLNRQLREALNPRQTAVQLGNQRYHLGDKVIHMRNNYDKNLFNGDIGRVTRIDPEAGTLAASFGGLEIEFERVEIADLAPAFAISIHKSQGSEFPVVVIPLLKQHFMLLQRNLIYTAITRGKKRVYIVGDPEAWRIAARNNQSQQRQTSLPERLRQHLLPRQGSTG